MEPVKSIGGFQTLPDYSFDTMPDDYAALVLIGGFGWATPIAGHVMPIVQKAIDEGKIVGAICNGASFLAKCGFLNDVRHTGNGLEQFRQLPGEVRIIPILTDISTLKQSATKTSSRQMVLQLLSLQKRCFCYLKMTLRSA